MIQLNKPVYVWMTILMLLSPILSQPIDRNDSNVVNVRTRSYNRRHHTQRHISSDQDNRLLKEQSINVRISLKDLQDLLFGLRNENSRNS